MSAKITIEDVAKEASVSIATVSRVLNDYPHVSKKVRIRVQEAIKKLSYQPSVFAQRLAGKILKTIGLVIPSYERVFHSYYGNEIVRSIGDACIDLDYDLLLHITSKKRQMNLSSVDGVIFADIIENEDLLEECVSQQKACVVINKTVADHQVSSVVVDNTIAAHEATTYLINLGHKRILHIAGDMRAQCAVQRLSGYKKALNDNGIQVEDQYIEMGNFSRIAARRAMEEILKLKNRPTAIFCASDDMAQEALFVIIEHGLRVPEDFSIIGFDDNPICLFGQIGLSSVRQPLGEMGIKGMEILDNCISGNSDVKQEVLPCRLVIRDSCDFV